MSTKTSAKGKYRVYESSTKFERAILFNSSEQLLTDGRKLMAGVSRIVIGKHFNVIEMLNGRKNVYTSDWHLLTRRVIAYRTWGDVIVTSEYEVEENVNYSSIKSIGLKVFNSAGKMLHCDIRGYMHLNQEYHLVQKLDHTWWYCSADGVIINEQPLCKVNVSSNVSVFMFDERGKLRLGCHCPYYDNELSFD